MKLIFRFVAVLVVVPATYYFLYWVPFSFFPFTEQRWIANVISLLCAVGAGWYVWKKLGDAVPSAATGMLLGAVVLGATGFCAGFFGPIMLNPTANQGPLLGIFITGPISAIIGAILGLGLALSPLTAQTRLYSLIVASVLIGSVTLYLSLPEPRYLGSVVDAEIRGCKSTNSLLSSALNRWEKLNAEDTWRTPREGWKEDVERMMREDQGVVLEMYVFRERDIVVNRKPWNKGVVEATEWKTENTLKDFYTRQNDTICDNYTKGARNLYFPKWEISSVSPPNILPTFLGLLVLGPVPDEHAALIRE